MSISVCSNPFGGFLADERGLTEVYNLVWSTVFNTASSQSIMGAVVQLKVLN